MKKRLLFATLAMVFSTSMFALEEGEYAFTKTGRVKVTGANILPNGNFDSNTTEGWTDADGNPVDSETWAVEPGVGENGENAIQSQGANEGKAFCQTLTLEAGTYVFSYQIRAAGEETKSGSTTIGTTVGGNYLDLFLNTDAARTKVASAEGALVADIALAENFSDQWKTVNYFFEVSDTLGAPNMLVIHLEKMATGLQFTNFAVNPAVDVYDIRIAQKKIDFAKLLANDPNFNTDAAAAVREELLNDVIPTVEGAMEAGALDDFATAEDMMNSFNDKLAEYLNASSVRMNPQLKGTEISDLTGQGKINRGDYNALTKYFPNLDLTGGNWQHPANADYLYTAIQGSYTNSGAYNVYHTDFPAGKYYITGEIRNAYVGKSATYEYTWTLETMCKIFIGNDSVEIGPIVGEDYQRFYLVANVDKDGNFRAGFDWPGADRGSAFFVRDVEVRSFDFDIADKYTHIQAYKKYKAQWDAAVAAHDKLLSMIDNSSYPWEQGTLIAAKEKYEPYFLAQEAKAWLTPEGEDAGIATTEEFEEWALYQGIEEYAELPEDAEEGTQPKRLEYQLVRGFQNACTQVANANQPIADLFAAIGNAKSVRNNPKNSTCDKNVIDPVIEAATAAYKEISANTNDERREADEATIQQQIEALATAIDAFEATGVIVPFVDIDFANKATQGDDGYEIAGEAGKMIVPSYQPDNSIEDTNFTQGYNGALEDVLRVGSSEAYVQLEQIPTDEDILEFNFDLWVGNLNKSFVRIQLMNANNERVAGFSINRYNGSVEYNEFNNDANAGMDILKYVTGIGSGSQSNGAICVDNNKSSFTLVIDYANGTVKGTVVNGKNGKCEGAEIPLNANLSDNKIVKFSLSSNYTSNAPARRCWFDNLQVLKYPGVAGIVGDVNGDGKVDVADITNILSIMAAGTNDLSGDVNGDGGVDVADITNVLNIMAGN